MRLDSAVLYSNNIEIIANFYQNIIGLELDYRQDDKYVSFKFDNGVRLGIKKAVEEREVVGSQTFFVDTDNIEKDYKKMVEKGVDVYKELSEQSWGKEFSILDPDKNKVEFIQRPKS